MKEKKKAILVMSLLSKFSIYDQKKIVVNIYKKQKTNLKKYKESIVLYENWMITHNINY